MQLITLVTILAAAASVSAAPSHHGKTVKITTIVKSNLKCGNNQDIYCCNGGKDCTSTKGSSTVSTCGGVTVCCEENASPDVSISFLYIKPQTWHFSR